MRVIVLVKMVNYEIEPATDASGHIDGHVDKKGGEVDDLALTSVPITAAEEVQKQYAQV